MCSSDLHCFKQIHSAVRHVCYEYAHIKTRGVTLQRILRAIAINMADSVTTSTANSSQNKANPSVSQAQTSQPTTSSSSTTAAPHVDTKVRNAGASLAEFLTQLEDYTPTVHFSLNYVLNFIGISFRCVYMLDSRERYFRCSLGAE